MSDIVQTTFRRLTENSDSTYRDFSARLTPNVDKEKVLGVRIPVLRNIAKDMMKDGSYREYISVLPHEYFDENNLHGILISLIKDKDEAVAALDEFLPYVDNWATCDIISPKSFARHTDELYQKIIEWTLSPATYTMRFGIEMLMSFYLDDCFNPKILEIVSQIRSDEYYVKMMVAWFFATALAKQYSDTLPYFESKTCLDPQTRKFAIQKAKESRRIDEATKERFRLPEFIVTDM